MDDRKALGMSNRINKGGLQIAAELHDFVVNEAIPGTGLDAEAFWSAFGEIIADLAPKNRALLQKREDLQAKIDAWHQDCKGQPEDAAA